MSGEDPIVWGDPPALVGGRRNPWPDRLAPCIARPEEWGMVRRWPGRSTLPAQMMFRLKKGIGCPPGKWEFTTRTIDGFSCLYARYMGPKEADS